jgi:membrane-associated phospholipid phosphatase
VTSSIGLKRPIALMLLAVLVTAFSYLFLDTSVALSIHRVTSSSELLTQATSNIPDLLLPIVIVATALSWTCYFILMRRGVQNRHTRFLRTCGTVLPIAYAAKGIFQYVFGRSTPYLWVFYHHLPRFYWFRMDEGYGCFPSGHMTVFTALAVALSYSYPRYRLVFLVWLALLAFLLVATNYHFISDVTSGAFVGSVIALVVTAGTLVCDKKSS